MRAALLSRPRRALLRTRVLVGVLVALAAFDVAGVTALRTYLIGQTDSGLRQVIQLYQQPHGLQVTLTLPAAPPTDLAN
jgi:hypothetical protein